MGTGVALELNNDHKDIIRQAILGTAHGVLAVMSMAILTGRIPRDLDKGIEKSASELVDTVLDALVKGRTEAEQTAHMAGENARVEAEMRVERARADVAEPRIRGPLDLPDIASELRKRGRLN